MKILFRPVIGFACYSVMFLSLFTAAGQEHGFYLKGDLGAAWTCNTELREFFGPVAPGSKVKLDTGVRFGVVGGYHVTDWFAAEFETGSTANSIDSITGATRVDAVLSRVPMLLNARFEWPTKCPVTPYLGGGVGGAVTIIDADPIEIGGTRLRGSEADMVFAYQAFAGLRYKINEHMGVSLEYHYFASGAPEWKADVTSGTASDRFRLGGIESHSVSVAFTYRF
jgi:opacity protein-like surface antigen